MTYYPQLKIHWHDNPRDCPHYNDNACRVCDFDHYYRNRIDNLKGTRP